MKDFNRLMDYTTTTLCRRLMAYMNIQMEMSLSTGGNYMKYIAHYMNKI